MFKSIDTMKNASQILGLIAQRQKALGDNLANVDTPGYTRKDVDFSKQLNSVGGNLETRMTSMFGAPPMINELSGEAVNSANEIVELQKNSMLYSMATRNMSSIITEMRTVINVGK